MARRTWRLVDALLLFLLFLLPLMLIVGRGEGTIERPTLLFWLMLILPLLILLSRLNGAAPEERREPPVCFIIGHMAIEPVPACKCSIMWLIMPSCIFIMPSRIVRRS